MKNISSILEEFDKNFDWFSDPAANGLDKEIKDFIRKEITELIDECPEPEFSDYIEDWKNKSKQ